MKRAATAKFWLMAYLMGVVVVGTVIVPDLPEMPPARWTITFALTCIAIGFVLGFGIKEFLMDDDDEN